MSQDSWQDRPVVASTRVLVRLDRTLVSASVHAGASPYGEPLWSSRWVLGLRRRDHRDLDAGALWWLATRAAVDREASSMLTAREWADEMARIRRI